MDKEPITVEGLEKLKLEIYQLKNIKSGVMIIFIYHTEKKYVE